MYGKTLRFWTLVAYQKGIDKQHRPRSDCFWKSFPVCYFEKHFVNSRPENQHFIWEQGEKSFWIFRTFTLYWVNLISSLWVYLGDKCIQNFHLGRYVVRYKVENLCLKQRASRAVKRDFWTYILWYTSPNENFEYGYLHSNALLQSCLKLERSKPQKAAQRCTSSNKMWRN